MCLSAARRACELETRPPTTFGIHHSSSGACPPGRAWGCCCSPPLTQPRAEPRERMSGGCAGGPSAPGLSPRAPSAVPMLRLAAGSRAALSLVPSLHLGLYGLAPGGASHPLPSSPTGSHPVPPLTILIITQVSDQVSPVPSWPVSRTPTGSGGSGTGPEAGSHQAGVASMVDSEGFKNQSPGKLGVSRTEGRDQG